MSTQLPFRNAKPFSWALVVQEGLNGENIVKYKGRWMIEKEKIRYERYDLKCKFQLMALPPEIRHHILSYLLPPDNYVAVYLPGKFGRMSTKIDLPAIAHAGDRLLRQETLMVTIEQTTFSIHSGPGNASFQEWLSSVDLTSVSNNFTNGFDAVKSLVFPYFSRFPHRHLGDAAPNNDIELMLKCPNLKKVRTYWVGEELVDWPGSGRKSVQQLRTEYRLDRMLCLHNLEELMLVGSTNLAYAGVGDMQQWFLSALPTSKDGKVVDVRASRYG